MASLRSSHTLNGGVNELVNDSCTGNRCIGQGVFAPVMAIGQSLVVEPELVQDRRLEVVTAHGGLGDPITDIVRRTVDMSGLESTSGHQQSERMRIVVASGAADRTIRFWQPTIGRMVRYVRLQAEPLNIAWTTDGARILAACADGHVRVIDPVDAAVTEDLPAIDGWAYAIAVHPSDNSVAVGGTNGRLRRLELRE